MDNNESMLPENPDRRTFLKASVGGAISALLARGQLSFGELAQAAPLVPDAVAPTIDHLPRKWEELLTLTDEQKILLAAATASGGDSVAYYTPNDQGTFSLAQKIDMYPGRKIDFAQNLPAYDAQTFKDEASVATHETYQIPVQAGNGALKGVVVVHAGSEKYDRDEPLNIRKAKLDMATDIVREHEDLFGATGQVLRNREDRHKSLPQKLQYFQKLIDDMVKTMTPDTFQIAHTQGVTRFMDLAIDKAVNAKEKLINDDQRQLMHELALLHDVGKTQMNSKFLTNWQNKDDPEYKDKLNYGTGHNNNHPLFSLVTLLMYPTDGLTTASHHHGLFRYPDEELKKLIGAEFDKYHILEDNIPDNALPMLSRILRVCDVSEAMTGRGDKSIDTAMRELAHMAGYDEKTHSFKPQDTNPNSISPECLCFLIDNGVFDAYGEEREASGQGWLDKKGTPKYDVEKVAAAKKEILDAFGWQQKKDAVETHLRAAVMRDDLIRENPGRAAQQGR